MGVNRLYVLIYPNQEESVKRFNGKKHYLAKGVIKSYNVVISGKTFMTKQLKLMQNYMKQIRKFTTEQS